MAGFSMISITFLIFLFIFIFIIILPFLLAYIIGLWATFKKCGKKGWYSIVPFYNTWVLNEIAELDWWYAIIIIIPSSFIIKNTYMVGLFNLVKAIASFFICYNIGKKFEKGIGTTILLFFFPFIMYPVIGFSKEFNYNKDIIVSKNGPIDLNDNNFSNNSSSNNNTNNNTNNNFDEKRYCSFCGNMINNTDKYCRSCGSKTNN